MTVRERPIAVFVLREAELTRWLHEQPATLSAQQVQHLAAVAAQPAAWTRIPEADAVDHTAFDRLRRDIERARRRRGLWVMAVITAVPVAFLGMWSAAVSLLVTR